MDSKNKNAPLITTRKEFVSDNFPFGVYVWRMPNGSYVADEERRWLSIASRRGDIKRIQELTDTVRSFGVDEGTFEFIEGARKISDEEFARQQERLEQGLIPDDHDIPAMMEENSE
jgi:hypothetical protein